jgi:hypothetical protein
MRSYVIKIIAAFIAGMLISGNTRAQDDSAVVVEKPSKIELSGYISNMQSVQFLDVQGAWINDNLLHNRLNFKWLPNDNIQFSIGLRNRLFTGETVKQYPDYGWIIKQSETGKANLMWNAVNEPSVLFNMHVDRLFFQYEKGKFAATVGRQRINWGKTFVWNPNDIFNAYSFFDFDYAERPGSDAIRLQYFSTAISSIEIAAKTDKKDQLTAAAIWRFNLKEYDFQLMGGILNSSDYVVGTAWSGAIRSVDFKGEMSYFHPKINTKDTTGQFIGSVSLGYTFPNTLGILVEFLYTDIPNEKESSIYNLYAGNLSVKTLSFTKYNLFAQAAYQITPLLNGSVSAIYYPNNKGIFIGPSFDYSFTDNLYASFVIQSFRGDIKNPLTQLNERLKLTYAFLRLKWNF